MKTHYSTLGVKRDELLRFAETVWGYWLDDDDWILPWYAEDLLKATVDYPEATMIQPKFAWHAIGGNDGSGNVSWKLATVTMPSIVRISEALNKFPHDKDSGEDQIFRARMKHIRIDFNPGYVYRWANGTFHASGSGDPLSGKELRREAAIRIEQGVEPQGDILLIPRLRYNYFNSMPRNVYKEIAEKWGRILPKQNPLGYFLRNIWSSLKRKT